MKLIRILKERKQSPLFSIVAVHPASMKDSILGQATTMLDNYDKISHKVESQLELNSEPDDGKSHAPSSPWKKNAIEAPSYLKGNKRLESIAMEGHELNEEHRQQMKS